MAARDGVYIVPTMQMTQENLAELPAGTLPSTPCGSSAAI